MYDRTEAVGTANVAPAQQAAVDKSELEQPCGPLCPVPNEYWHWGKCDLLTEEGFNIHIMNDHESPDVCKHYMVGIGKELNVGRNYNNAQD